MENLLAKLSFRGEARICILNGPRGFLRDLSLAVPGLIIDQEIDQRFPYNFVLVFASGGHEVDNSLPAVVHNLYDDGILWYIYPKQAPAGTEKPLSRDRGWESARELGLDPVRHVCFDEGLSATRLRNRKYIKRKNKK